MKVKTDELSILEALRVAAKALWLSDDSDYAVALYDVIKHLSPELYENIGEGEVTNEHVEDIEDAQKQHLTSASPSGVPAATK